MHLNSDLALDLIEGRLVSSEIPALTEHTQRCRNCGQQLTEWRRIHSRLTGPHLKSAPPALLEDAETIFGGVDGKPTTFPEIIAAVVFDSLLQPALAGARGTTDARQILMHAEELDIHLKISTNPPQHQILGQVFVRNDSQFLNNVRLHLLRDGTPFKSTWSDNFGDFRFDEVPHGVFRLQIDLPELTVVAGISISEHARE
jgi:hypothetical protein